MPVYAHHLRDAPNLSKFAHFKFADCLAYVTDEQEEDIGSIGGVMGGHYEIHLNRDNGSDSEATLNLDRQDVWNAVCELLDSPEGQAVVASLREKAQREYEQQCREFEDERTEKERLALERELTELDEREEQIRGQLG